MKVAFKNLNQHLNFILNKTKLIGINLFLKAPNKKLLS